MSIANTCVLIAAILPVITPEIPADRGGLAS